MTSSQKFLFDTSFDCEATRRASKPAPAPVEPEEPTFSKDELEAARAEGLASGHAEGYAEAQQAAKQTGEQALAAIEQALSALATSQAEMATARERDGLAAATTILRKLFPAFARTHAMDEIESVIAECLGHLRDEPRIVVRVADDLLDALRDRLSQVARAAGFQGKIVLLSDDTLQDSAVRLEWADGGAERDPAQTWREIDDILGRILGPAQKADPEDPDGTAMPAASAPSEPNAGQPAIGLAQSA